MRRLLVPLLGVSTLCLVVGPLLADNSANTASFVGAVAAVLVGLALRSYLENALAWMVISPSGLVRTSDTVRLGGWYGTGEGLTAKHVT